MQAAAAPWLGSFRQEVVKITPRDLIQRAGDTDILMHPDLAVVADLFRFVARLQAQPFLIMIIFNPQP